MTRDEAIAAGMAVYWDCEHESEADARVAFVASLAASGFAVVPVEATAIQRHAAQIAHDNWKRENGIMLSRLYDGVWRAMLAAAQEDICE